MGRVCCSSRILHFLGIAFLPGPTCDSANRVTQACRLKRIASEHDRRSGRIGDFTDHRWSEKVSGTVMLFLGPPAGTKRQFPASQKRFPAPLGIPSSGLPSDGELGMTTRRAVGMGVGFLPSPTERRSRISQGYVGPYIKARCAVRPSDSTGGGITPIGSRTCWSLRPSVVIASFPEKRDDLHSAQMLREALGTRFFQTFS